MKLSTFFRVAIGLIKTTGLKLIRWNDYDCSYINSYSLSTELVIHKGGKLKTGKHVSALNDVTISVASGAELKIGDYVNINKGCSIIAKQKITIGDYVSFGPNCGIYDHDHDYKKRGRERQIGFITGDVEIGNGVWFGANCIILKDTVIGDNCVFGAGCIIKGNYDANTVVVQERKEILRNIIF